MMKLAPIIEAVVTQLDRGTIGRSLRAAKIASALTVVIAAADAKAGTLGCPFEKAIYLSSESTYEFRVQFEVGFVTEFRFTILPIRKRDPTFHGQVAWTNGFSVPGFNLYLDCKSLKQPTEGTACVEDQSIGGGRLYAFESKQDTVMEISLPGPSDPAPHSILVPELSSIIYSQRDIINNDLMLGDLFTFNGCS